MLFPICSHDSPEVAGKARAEVPSLVMSSCCFWLPANAANFMRLEFCSRFVVAFGVCMSL